MIHGCDAENSIHSLYFCQEFDEFLSVNIHVSRTLFWQNSYEGALSSTYVCSKYLLISYYLLMYWMIPDVISQNYRYKLLMFTFYIVNYMDVTNLTKLQVILNGFPLSWSKLGQCT